MATEILSTPVSFIGATKRILPAIPHKSGWARVGMTVVIGLVLLLAYVGVLLWYAFLTGIPVLWVPWVIYTLSRRHRIHRDKMLRAVKRSDER